MSFWNNLLKPNNDISSRDKIEQQEEQTYEQEEAARKAKDWANGEVNITTPHKTTVKVTDKAVIIQHKGLLDMDNGETEIPYSSISSMQFTRDLWYQLTINTKDAQDQRGAYGALYNGLAVGGRTPGRNTIQYGSDDNEIMHTLAAFIQKKVDALKQPAAAQLDPADQIAKFKKLADQGVITQEEFEAKKKQLLGL